MMTIMKAIKYMKQLNGCTGFCFYCANRKSINVNDRERFSMVFVRGIPRVWSTADYFCYTIV